MSTAIWLQGQTIWDSEIKLLVSGLHTLSWQVLQWWKTLVAQSHQRLYVSTFSYETDHFRFFWKIIPTSECSKLIECGLVQICTLWLVDCIYKFFLQLAYLEVLFVDFMESNNG